MKEMKEMIENYQKNINESEKLHKKLIQLLEYNTKITATYGHNTGGGRGVISDKVCRHVLKIRETEEKLMKLENRIYIVNQCEKVLNKKEKEVIDLIKSGYRNKITRMAKILGKDKNYIITKRDTAIKKMSEWR